MYSESAKLLYRRMMMICCRAWGIAPDEFRKRAAANQINWYDVAECLRMVISSDPFAAYWVEHYFDPEGFAARKERVEKLKVIEAGYRRALSQFAPPYRSEEEREIAHKNIQLIQENYNKARSEL